MTRERDLAGGLTVHPGSYEPSGHSSKLSGVRPCLGLVVVVIFGFCLTVGDAGAQGGVAPDAARSCAGSDCRRPRSLSIEGQWSTGVLTPFERPDDFQTLIPSDAAAASYEMRFRGQPPQFEDDNVAGSESEWWETDVPLARVRGEARTSWIVAPVNGRLPYRPAARARAEEWRRDRLTKFDGPETRPLAERCLATAGPPLMPGPYLNGLRIVVTTRAVVIWAEWMDDLRIVRLEGGRAPPPLRTRGGDSIGHWEGETLVVETAGFRGDGGGDPTQITSSEAQVVERFTPLSNGELHYDFRLVDEAQFTGTVRGEMVLQPTEGRLFEFACHEGNYALRNVLAGARAEQHARDAEGTAPGSSASASRIDSR